MRSQINGRRRTSAALGILLALVVAGGAFAYWTIGGSGSGTATAGTVVAVTVNQEPTSGDMYPGGPGQALSGDFDNPNDGLVYVSSVTAVVRPFSWRPDASKPACTEADFEITGGSPDGTVAVGVEIASGNGVGSWGGLTVSMLNSEANQDNCKNIEFDIDYTANP